MCGLTPLVLVGFVVGAVASTLTGSDLAGWVAGLAAFAVAAWVQHRRGTPVVCTVTAPARDDAALGDAPTSATDARLDPPEPTTRSTR